MRILSSQAYDEPPGQQISDIGDKAIDIVEGGIRDVKTLGWTAQMEKGCVR